MRWSWIAHPPFSRFSFTGSLFTGCLVTLILLSSPAAAQFAQYTPPGGPDGRPESLQERLEGAMEEARWRLGPVRLEPWLGLKDVGWVDNLSGAEQEDTGGDLTATAGAGLRAYLPTGPKVVWAAHVLPEYVWFRDHDELNDVNGRYGVGFFGSFNRLQAQATLTRDQELGIVSSERLERASSRSDELALDAELRLAGSLYLFASWSEGQSDYLNAVGTAVGDPGGRSDLDQLDRTERITRGGLRFRTRGGWAIGVGAERSQVDFEQAAADRSNSGTSPVLVISSPLDRRLYLGIDLVLRSLEPAAESTFLPYDGVTGMFHLLVGSEDSRLQPSFYASRNLVYALTAPYSYYEADRIGAALTLNLGWRTSVRAFGEVGRDDYAALDPDLKRQDDVTAFGVSLGFGLRSGVQLTLGFSREEVSSDLPGADRSVTFVRSGVSFGSGLTPWY